MKKSDLAKLALFGISAGLVAGGCQQKANKNESHDAKKNGNNAEQSAQDMESFKASLSPEAKKQFDELDAKHKMMAVEMANQECKGKNKCSGIGGCATKDNSCAGKNSCKGKGGPPVDSPEKAVEVQYKAQMNGDKK